jgi:hypothetical protein
MYEIAHRYDVTIEITDIQRDILDADAKRLEKIEIKAPKLYKRFSRIFKSREDRGAAIMENPSILHDFSDAVPGLSIMMDNVNMYIEVYDERDDDLVKTIEYPGKRIFDENAARDGKSRADFPGITSSFAYILRTTTCRNA